jgi:hypothetical protein
MQREPTRSVVEFFLMATSSLRRPLEKNMLILEGGKQPRKIQIHEYFSLPPQ